MTSGIYNHKPHSDETKKKISLSNLGKKIPFKKRHPHSDVTKLKMSIASKGKKKSLETRKKMSLSKIGLMCGCKSPLWKGGCTTEQERLRKSYKTKNWRRLVFIRDNFTCQYCGQIGGKLNAHHIKKWSDYPELRHDVDNGITLCIFCHIQLHKVIKKLQIKK